MDTFPLFGVTTVHCISCPHVVQGLDPETAHDRMEDHYASEHAGLIRSMTTATEVSRG